MELTRPALSAIRRRECRLVKTHAHSNVCACAKRKSRQAVSVLRKADQPLLNLSKQEAPQLTNPPCALVCWRSNKAGHFAGSERDCHQLYDQLTPSECSRPALLVQAHLSEHNHWP